MDEDSRLDGKQPHNDAVGCRELAKGSLTEAALSVVPNQRLRLENSAATWTARADMLERLDRHRSDRLAVAAAEKTTGRSA